MKLLSYLFAILICLNFTSTYSQEWTIYNTANSGLTTNNCRVLKADSKGNIWIGTDDGLFRFNDDTWTHYTASPNGLPYNNIYSGDVHLDYNDRLWFIVDNYYRTFDGENWETKDSGNTCLPWNETYYWLVVDKNNSKLVQNHSWLGGKRAYFLNEDTCIHFTREMLNLEFNEGLFLVADEENNFIIMEPFAGIRKYIPSTGEILEGNFAGSGIGIDTLNNKIFLPWSGHFKVLDYNLNLIETRTLSALDIYPTFVVLDHENNLWFRIAENKITKYSLDNYSYHTFSHLNSPLPNSSISGLAVDVSNNIWIATSDSGIFVYNSAGISSLYQDENNIQFNFALHQNYPNPFNPSTKIKYEIPFVGSRDRVLVQIQIYDVLGNEVATLVDEYKPTGSYEVEFNAGGLPSGIYFYKLKAANFVKTKKMILLR